MIRHKIFTPLYGIIKSGPDKDRYYVGQQLQ